MRPGVRGAGQPVGGDRRERAEEEDARRRRKDGEQHHLHLERLDLLAEVFGRAPDHQAGDEDGQDHEDQDPVEARADAAGRRLAEQHEGHRDHPGESG